MRLTRLLRVFALSLACANTAMATTAGDESLRVAVHVDAIRDTSRADLEVALKVWAEDIKRILRVPADITFYRAMSEIRRDLDVGKVNFVIADGINLLRYFEPEDLADGFGAAAANEDSMMLLARRDSGLTGFKDIAGKRIVLLSDNELSDLLLETSCLRNFHMTCERAGVVVMRESRSQQQVLHVFFGKADAALVRGHPYDVAVEMNPQIQQRLHVLERIAIYPTALGLFGARVSASFREYVIGKVPEMERHPRGRQLLEVMQTDRVGRFPKSVLEPIRRLMREHEALSRRYAQAKATK